MEKLYVKFQRKDDLGTRVNYFPITDGQVDFSKTHVKCRDWPCLFVFLFFILGSVGLLVYSIIAGKPGLVYKPIDSLNGICGFDFQGVNNKGRPYLVTGDPLNLCVSKCPTSENNCACSNQSAPFHAENQSDCLNSGEKCCYEGEDTEPLMDYCVEKSDANAANKGGSQIIRDIISRLWICGIALAITAGLCIVYVILLIFFAYQIVWGSIFVSLGGIALLGIAFVILAVLSLTHGDTGGVGIGLIAMGAMFLLLTIIAGIVIMYMRARINLCISLIQETCRGLRALPCLCFVPIIFTLLSGGAYVVYGINQVYLMGTSKVTVELGIRSIEVTPVNNVFFAITFFVIMWVSFACIGFAQSVIAGGLAAWYFSDDRKNLRNKWPVASSFWRTFRYSAGTILFGSGIIALIELIKMLSSSGKKKDSGGNMLSVCLRCCLQCLLDVIERFIIFLSQRAYIVASVTGNGFLQSCKDSFRLLLRNIITTLVLENIKTLPITVGKLFIFIISAAASLIICNPFIFSKNSSSFVVEYWYLVYIICVVIIFFVLLMMTTLVTYGIDSIFIFYLIDSEYARSSGGIPFASPDLVSHMDGDILAKGRAMASKYNLSIPADPPLPTSSSSSSSSSSSVPGYTPPSASAFDATSDASASMHAVSSLSASFSEMRPTGGTSSVQYSKMSDPPNPAYPTAEGYPPPPSGTVEGQFGGY